MNRIYFDYNATTPLSKEVLDFYTKELAEYANGSSLHQEGREVAASIEKARQQIASLVHCEPGELVFTSGGSESNNTVFNTMVALSK
ncbi:MAG: aminotransferase class V-fold PLP-dependent enzyme, partial [Spirochaetaceae bacterium]|nr:aminotransferase class V-fold PLP-dependent enzyme [Spirochaetaceae bacterium]